MRFSLRRSNESILGHTGTVASDNETLARIHDLVAQERELRERLVHRQIDESEENARLRAIEVELDQCWDLLRQRRALRETGGNPSDASVRPGDEVEDYLS
nr:DUF2630 family protein [Mycolicibacterium sphagni]